MLDLDRLTTQDLEDLAGEVGDAAVEALLDGEGLEGSRLTQVRIMSALHWLSKRRSDPDWSLADSREMSIEDLMGEVGEALDDDAPKSGSPDGTPGSQPRLESARD
ncbi:MAG: hypothetical protein OXT70_01305 [Chloroflexota bacterium]|nr:hypothetical protein [Chloroflexota bacterium]